MSKAINFFTIFTILFIGLGETACKHDTKAEYREEFQKGIKLFDRNLNKEAKDVFSKCITLNPKKAEPYYYRGCCYMNLHDMKNAMNDFNKAIEINPQYAEAYYNRGLIYELEHNKDKMCENWQLAAENGKPNMNDKLQFCR
jgi:Tfp pilus assembly protein PilF